MVAFDLPRTLRDARLLFGTVSCPPQLSGHGHPGHRRVVHGLRDQRELRFTTPEGPRRDGRTGNQHEHLPTW